MTFKICEICENSWLNFSHTKSSNKFFMKTTGYFEKKTVFADALWWLAMAIMLAAFVWLRLSSLAAYGNEFDEGLFLMTARLVHAGNPLYTAVFSDAGPVFVAALVSAFHLWGDSVATGRALMLAFAVLALVGMGYWGRETIGGWGGLLAAAILAAMPPFARESMLVLRDTPALAFAVWAIVMATRYSRYPRGLLAAATGGLFALSLLTKFLFPAWGAAPVILLAAPHLPTKNWRRMLLAFAWAAAGAAVPILLVAVWINLPEMFRQTFAYRIAVRAVYQEHGLAHNLSLIWLFLKSSWFAFPAIVAGILIAAQYRRWMLGIPVLLLVLQLAMMAVQAPLHVHGLVSLLPPLALLAAQGANGLFSPRKMLAAATIGGAAMVVSLAGVLLWGWQPPQISVTLPDNPPAEAIKLLQFATAPDTPVIADDPMLVYRADRRVLPWLADTSISRLKSQSVSVAELIALTDEFSVPVVWLSTRFPPPYADWLRENFAVDWTQDGIRHLFLGRKYPPAENAPLAVFDGTMALDGADIPFSRIRPGDWLTVDLRWRAITRVPYDVTLFVQVLNSAGQVVAQMDRPPVLNLLPVSAWELNTTIADPIFIPLPDDIVPGQYRLMVGLYHPETVTRLAVAASVLPVESDAMVITDQLKVEAR